MKALIELQKTIYPDLLEVMQKRYNVLYTIYLSKIIGRRGIIEQTNLPERFVRKEINTLQDYSLIDMTPKGVTITEKGENVIEELREFIRELNGLVSLENKIQEKTGIQHIVVVPGNSDKGPFVKQELGSATIHYLKSVIEGDQTIAVTGGTTMAAVADVMQPFNGHHCMFVPARGGVGEEVENQANTIAAQMAKAEKGNYRMLHVPDPLSETLYQTLLHEPMVKETLPIIKNASYVLHGIGDAITMATRRKTSQEHIEILNEEQAVSEAFGYYFNEAGEIVHKVRTIGIHLEDLEHANVISIAGGKSKAQAIASFVKLEKSNVLITDEAAANEMLDKNLL